MALYNGNISETYWKSSSDNVLRKYGYSYDGLNRLNASLYMKPMTSQQRGMDLGSYNEHITYDKNGNINTLFRNGDLDSNLDIILIDDLDYIYDSGNKLLKVIDNSNHPEGFKDGANWGNDYVYDDFGNMTRDDNKGITSITYNHLNLPKEIVFDNNPNKKIDYLYNALGQKVRKTVTDDTVVTRTDYLDGFHYENNVLKFFATAEGYVNSITSGGGSQSRQAFSYVYNYADHLGNIRVSYTNSGGNAVIIEENHYYPFGLKHKKYGSTVKDLVEVEDGEDYYVGIEIVPPGARKTYQYKYNHQEWQDELNLNMYDMPLRDYDPAIGRWVVQDPVVHFSLSPYNGMDNNPVFWADPSGGNSLNSIDWNKIGLKYDWNSGSYMDNGRRISNDDAVSRLFDIANTPDFGDTYVLPAISVKGGWNGNKVHLWLSYDTEIQNHLYTNSPFHQYVRDERRAARWNSIQNDLDWIGAIPGLGEPIDLVNAGISAIRGDYARAGLSLGAMIPVGGYVANAIKIQRHHIIPKAVYRNADDAIKNAMSLNAGNNLKKLPAGFHGNHPQYSKYVTDQLNAIDNVTPGSIQTLQKDLNGMINNAYDNYKATGQNLNEYFRTLNGN